MDLSLPLSSIAPSLDAETLTVLARTSTPLTGRQVASLARRGSQPGIQRVLDRLVTHGLVHAQPAGAATLYALNRDHLLAAPLAGMVAARDTLLERLRISIETWTVGCVHASVFGSLARGEAGPHSDIDVLVVRADTVAEDDPEWHEQLGDLESRARRWTGNHLSWFETTTADLGRALEEPVVASWRRDAVHLTGVRLSRLLDRVSA